MNKFYIISDINKYKFFEDYIESLISKLKNVIKIIDEPCNIDKWLINEIKNKQDNNYYIFANWHYNVINNIKNNNIYIINFEQLSRDYLLDEVKNLTNNFKIINYSFENHRLLNSNNSIYIPYQVNYNEIFNYKKIFDICFIGCIENPYRNGILNNEILKNKITIINKFGKERDEELFKYKIIINIHYTKEYNILEEIRINRCIFNKVIVISENSKNMNNYYLKDHIIFCDYNQIASKSIEVLNNYDFYYTQLFKNLDLKCINNFNKDLLEL